MDILMVSKLDVQLSDTHGDESKNNVEEMKEEEPKVDEESKPDIPDMTQSSTFCDAGT